MRGNVTTKIDPLGAQTTFSYYPDGDWVKFETDHYGNTKSMAYDDRGNVTVQTMGASVSEDPASPTTGHTTRTAYNALSAPTQITDPCANYQIIDTEKRFNWVTLHCKEECYHGNERVSGKKAGPRTADREEAATVSL